MQNIKDVAARGARILAAAMLVPFLTLMNGGIAHASTTNSIYSYDLTGSGSSFSNNAASNSGATLSILNYSGGSPSGTQYWSHSSYGIHFTGNLTNQQTGAGYKPSTGNTVNTPATSSLGAAVRFQYQAPGSGNCFSDSPNITQIGRFAANTGQLKIQLSNCGDDSSHVHVMCRLAGASTPSTVLPVMNSLSLANNGDYIAKCYKTPDPGSGNATVTLRVVKVDTLNGNTVENDTFSVAPTGAITSTAYLSVANKLAFPAQADNTDQFVGDIKKVSYCQATTTTAVSTCLDTEIAEPGLDPSVINTSVSGPSSLQIGSQGTYTVTTSTSSSTPGSNGVSSVLTVPSNMTIVSAAGATISGQTATWSLGNLGIGTTVNKTATVSLDSGTVGGTATVSAATTTTNGACSTSGSTCSASYGTTIAAGSAPVLQLAFNQVPVTLEAGQEGTYQLDTLLTQASATGVTTVVTVPSNMTIVHATGATISGQTATWSRGNISPVHYVDNVTLRLDSGTVGSTIPVSFAATTTDGTCTDTGSACSVSTSSTTVANSSNAPLTTSMSGPSSLQVGSQGTYTTSVQNTGTNEIAMGTTLVVTVPSNMSIVNGHGATVSGQTATLSLGSLAPGTSSLPVDVQLNSGTPGDTATVSAAVTTSDDACSLSGSTCSTSVNTTVAAASNPVVTTSLSGPSSLQPGQQGTYTATTQNTASGTTATGVSTSVTVPSNMSIVTATGATISGNTATWSNGDMSGGSSATNTVVAQLDTGNGGDTATVSATTTTTDSSCTNTGSSCTSSANTTVDQIITNSSVESNMTGWTGTYGSSSLVSNTQNCYGGHAGSCDILVTALTGASNSSLGFNDNPRWVTNTDTAKTYSGSVWVRASFSGQVIHFRLREWNGSTLVTDNNVTWTASGANWNDWHQITNSLTPAGNGHQLSFVVQGSGMNAGDSFEVDDMVLVSN
ncbi:MAG TPA: hypothetical protein VLE99_01635 [Candidatus Saccharimonadales bacterium]|nr:hypothetical protein [Candidatus Saccharimonadales bacterium]